MPWPRQRQAAAPHRGPEPRRCNWRRSLPCTQRSERLPPHWRPACRWVWRLHAPWACRRCRHAVGAYGTRGVGGVGPARGTGRHDHAVLRGGTPTGGARGVAQIVAGKDMRLRARLSCNDQAQTQRGQQLGVVRHAHLALIQVHVESTIAALKVQRARKGVVVQPRGAVGVVGRDAGGVLERAAPKAGKVCRRDGIERLVGGGKRCRCVPGPVGRKANLQVGALVAYRVRHGRHVGVARIAKPRVGGSAQGGYQHQHPCSRGNHATTRV